MLRLFFHRYFARRPFWRELAIFLIFCLWTALLSWPYVTRLRDVVMDAGDPYLVAWILWWDYHQTFTNPLNLFHANVFYPYRYTLAFSEHMYGIALLFFPLFALGLRPLTIHAVAMFFGFATCGYGAFRLARTLTASNGVAWVAGIIFAFVPYRFHLLSHLPYLFSGWVPLLFEALVLFTRAPTRRRAAWLGGAFFMTGLTTISWFTLSLVPFALSAAVLTIRYPAAREGAFWRRGTLALGVAAIALFPFMLPYYIVSKMYGFVRSIEEVRANSALPIHWLVAEGRNRLWSGLGANLPGGWKFKLFPGLLPLLLSLAAVVLVEPFAAPRQPGGGETEERRRRERKRLLLFLDAFALVALVVALIATGFEGAPLFFVLPFSLITMERALFFSIIAVVTRLCLAYPNFLRRGENANLIATIRSARRGDAHWLACVLIVVGFCYSLGMNFFFYRILYDFVPLFKSMRVPTRGAMFCYLGLALLSGLGTARVAKAITRRRPRVPPAAIYAAACALLLFEMNAAPLQYMRGDVFPDAVTLRLKETEMRGGIVILPAGPDYNHRYMLRAADHARPLVVGTSGFNPPYEDQIEWLTRSGAIPAKFLDLLEEIPASYLVVATNSLAPERRVEYEAFLTRAVDSGRLRFIRRFDARDDLYAVVKTEPEAKSEAAMPFGGGERAWDALLGESPVHLLNQFQSWSQRLYRLHLATFGRMPRFAEFMPAARTIARGAEVGIEGEDERLAENLREFADAWVARPEFRAAFKNKSDEQYLDELVHNAGITPDAAARANLIENLKIGAETRASVLLKVIDDPQFVERERYRSLVLLHYFGYLRRDPGSAPDKNMDGFKYWLNELERFGDTARLTAAFAASGEYKALSEQH